MSISDVPLWQRIENFNIDEEHIVLPCSKRLAHENSWSGEFALRVIEEYKKFIYLACISVKPVTPSDEIDQAWHLHLTYTQSYWDHFCHKVLPMKGSKQEADKFKIWYVCTKTLYEQEFGTQPPRNIWHQINESFSRQLYMKMVDTSTHLVLRKSLF